MATLAEVQGDIATLQAAVDEANSKMDLIAALVASLRAGGIVSEADLDSLRAGIAAVSSVVGDVLGKQNSVLNP